MLIVLSPAKTLDYDTPPVTDAHTTPEFLDDAAELIGLLKTFSPAQIGSLMDLSDKLAVLNVTRYAAWSRRFTKKNAKQAVLAFNGDVYDGLDAPSFGEAQLRYAQAHLRILSGLYGVLRPLDLMQPYRLEMGTRLSNARGKDLYAFWGDRIANALNRQLAETGAQALVNLASEEYFKAVRVEALMAPVITPVFEDWKNGQYKIISFHAKRARGMMARYAALHQIRRAQDLRRFDAAGYAFAEAASTADRWVFRRRTAEA